jgi:hypothetical protein
MVHVLEYRVALILDERGVAGEKKLTASDGKHINLHTHRDLLVKHVAAVGLSCMSVVAVTLVFCSIACRAAVDIGLICMFGRSTSMVERQFILSQPLAGRGIHAHGEM